MSNCERCFRRVAIQKFFEIQTCHVLTNTGLLRRYTPRNDILDSEV